MSDLLPVETQEHLDRLKAQWGEIVRLHEEYEQVAEVSSEKESADAAGRIKEIREAAAEIDAARKDATTPLNRMVRQINDFCRPYSTSLEAVRDRWRKKLIAWQKAEIRRREEAEAKAREDAQAKRAEAQAAAEAGDEIEAAQAAQAADDVEAQARAETAVPLKTPAGYGATGSSRKVWKWRVLDIAQLPVEAVTVNESYLNQMAKVKPQPPAVPGVEWYEDLALTVR